MITFGLWFIISCAAVWQLTEILHHSAAGNWWRSLGKYFEKNKATKWLGELMSCPFCYSNYLGIFFVGIGACVMFNPFFAMAVAIVGGLAAARAANMANDLLASFGWIRTPNVNENSRSMQMDKLFAEQSAAEQHYEPFNPATSVFGGAE